MKISRVLLRFSLLYLQLLVCMSQNDSCIPLSCLSSQISIEFPFRMNDVQPKSCGSPGFDVSCDNKSGKPLLHLHSAGNLSIDYIYYYGRQVYLSDPNNCLPQKLLSLNLTKISPFRALEYTNFSLYNCSGRNYERNYSHDKIDCLSGSAYTVISVVTGRIIRGLNCSLLKVVSAPGSNSFSQLSSNSSFSLTWDLQDPSSICLSCGYNGAPDGFGRDKGSGGSTGVGVGIGLGITAFLIGIAYYSWQRSRRNRRVESTTDTSNQVGWQTDEQNHTIVPVVTSGLDQRVIDSYPMVIIGESAHLIKPGDDTCPICLSEYSPNDKVRILPECIHRFHADCIDEWLRTKPICPICRMSPSHS